jgi:hypothetical protein
MYKAFRVLLTASLFILLFSGFALAQHTCLAFYNPVPSDPSHWHNPDSVMVDTCHADWEFGQLFARQWWQVYFTYNVLPLPASSDSVLEVTWDKIDTSYGATRTGMALLEQHFGGFVIRKLYPSVTDTNTAPGREFAIRFQNYCNIDSVMLAIKAISLCDASYNNQTRYIRSVSASQSLQPIPIKFWPQPAQDVLNIEAPVLGTIRLLNSSGQIIFHSDFGRERRATLYLQQIPTGAYFLQSGTQEHKFSIVR